jgi:putative ABC transport system permease protein
MFREDISYGFRLLWRHWTFTVISLITFALGIGVSTAIFSVVKDVLLRPLPYTDSSRLVSVWSTLDPFPDVQSGESAEDFLDIKSSNDVLEQMALYRTVEMDVRIQDHPEQISVSTVSAEFFDLLGIHPALGRLFSGDDMKSSAHVLILSDALWRRRFQASPTIIGKSIVLGEKDYLVIGVMPRSFAFPTGTDGWIPIDWADSSLGTRRVHVFPVLGKLRPGVALETAQADMQAIGSQLARSFPDEDAGLSIHLVVLKDQIVEGAEPGLVALSVGAVLLLLIACANVWHLFLGRSLIQRKELAVRAALGARRIDLVRQIFIQSMLLSIAGGFVGVLFAAWGVSMFRSIAPASTPRLAELRIDSAFLGLALAITIVSGCICGLLPMILGSTPDPNTALKGGVAEVGHRAFRIETLLIVCEIAFTMMLLFGALAFAQSFFRLVDVKLGFRADHLLSVPLSLQGSRYSNRQQQVVFAQEMLEKVASLPGVRHAAVTSSPVLSGSKSVTQVRIEALEALGKGDSPVVQVQDITPHFFDTMGVQLLAGRDFGDQDVEGGLPVAIVSNSMAHSYWGDQSPVGKRISSNTDSLGRPVWATIVGIVADVRIVNLASAPKPQIFFPLFQEGSDQMDVLVRTASDPVRSVGVVKDQIWSIDENQPIGTADSVEHAISRSVATPHLRALLLGAFATFGMLLTVVGIYGVVSYMIAQRTKEFAIRMALGARERDILLLVIRQGLGWALTGVAVGSVGVFCLAKTMAHMFFAISGAQATTYCYSALIVIGVVLLACYVPALKATSIEPISGLRHY